jgi:hypothetical protein
VDEMVLDERGKYSVTELILELVTDLEKRGYYPQDLKCNNLLLDD